MHQITFRSARLNKKMTIEQVSEMTGITVEELDSIERDSSQATVSKARKLLILYKISCDHVFIGKDPYYEIQDSM